MLINMLIRLKCAATQRRKPGIDYKNSVISFASRIRAWSISVVHG